MNHIEEQYRKDGIQNGASLITVAFTCLILAGLVALSSCAFTGCAGVKEGSDPLVVRAEQASEIAFETFDTFLKFEFENKELLLKTDPKIHETADLIRRDGLTWISDLREATKAYKKARDPDSQAKLHNSLTALQNVLTQAQKYLERKP